MRRPALTLEQRRDVIADAACAAGVVTTLRAGGDTLTTAARDEMLAKCMAGAFVELELDMLAFEQQPGVRNRKSIRFRDGAMMSLGRTGKGTPFLRDHNQGDTMSRGGTIVSSATEKLGDGHYAIRQTAKLTAPWAVELALRGLLDTLSIGWTPTGPILCSLCETPILEDCWHWRGDVVTSDDGTEQVVEWVFTEAELTETSSAPVPAVKTAHIEAIRMALALSAGGDPVSRARTAHEDHMTLHARLLTLLGLAATAGEPEVLSAVETTRRERDAAVAELGIARKDLATASAELAILTGEKKKTAQDTFIADAIASGRIAAGDDASWRVLHEVDAKRAETLMSARPVGASTPVGLPRQSGTDPTPPPAVPAPALGADVATQLAARGIDPAKVGEISKLFGVTNPGPAIADALKKGA